jgi:hypothetical protein
MRKFLAVFLGLGLCVGAELWGMSGEAGATTAPDQIVLTGTCISAAQIQAADNEALNVYYLDAGPGDQPAGVWINTNWVPASLLSEEVNQFYFCE